MILLLVYQSLFFFIVLLSFSEKDNFLLLVGGIGSALLDEAKELHHVHNIINITNNWYFLSFIIINTVPIK